MARDLFNVFGSEVTVSEAEPLVANEFTVRVTCPHGVKLYAEPTGEQMMAWARAGKWWKKKES